MLLFSVFKIGISEQFTIVSQVSFIGISSIQLSILVKVNVSSIISVKLKIISLSAFVLPLLSFKLPATLKPNTN